jgi:hypothetical protein
MSGCVFRIPGCRSRYNRQPYTLEAPLLQTATCIWVVTANRRYKYHEREYPRSPLLHADYFSRFLKGKGIQLAVSFLLQTAEESQQSTSAKRDNLVTTYSPPISENSTYYQRSRVRICMLMLYLKQSDTPIIRAAK